MEIRHRTISDLRLNGYGRSKSDMIAEMQENCEVYNELVASRAAPMLPKSNPRIPPLLVMF
jgi:hypothetical protein